MRTFLKAVTSSANRLARHNKQLRAGNRPVYTLDNHWVDFQTLWSVQQERARRLALFAHGIYDSLNEMQKTRLDPSFARRPSGHFGTAPRLHAHTPESRQLLPRTSASGVTTNRNQRVGHEINDSMNRMHRTRLDPKPHPPAKCSCALST